MGIIQTTDYIFPVYGGEMINDEFKPKILLGTSFYIGGNVFITAGHVVENSLNYKEVVLGFSRIGDKGFFRFSPIKYCEFKSDPDIGIIGARIIEAKAFRWDLKRLPALSDVQSYGFPFGLDTEKNLTYIRCFKGYIVSAGRFFTFNSKPKNYELSFHCPRGLSGAPIGTWGDPEVLIKGIVIGNVNSEIEIYSEKEVDKSNNETTFFQKMETTKFGIGIQTEEICELYFDKINMKIYDHLKANGLII